LQHEVLTLNADRFARLQIIQSLAAPPAVPTQSAPTPRPPSPDQRPKISVVIPMGRPERAGATLQALAQQTVLPAAWELIAVGVGVGHVPAQFPSLPITTLEMESSPGPAHKRAHGVLRATGDWLVFIDDDVRVAPDFFEMLLRILPGYEAAPAAGTKPVGAIGGRIPGGRGTFFEGLTDISNFWSQQSLRRSVPHAAWFLYSAAMIVRADAYHHAGGFNQDLLNGEDVDLTQRVQAAGYCLAYEPSLVAYHHHGQDTLFRMWRYFWRNGNAAPYFFAQFGGVCGYSIRTVLARTWGDFKMNRDYQRGQGGRLGLRAPWVLLNYLILEISLERNYQSYLWREKKYASLPARTRSDQLAKEAFNARASGHSLKAITSYLAAMILNLGDPVRR
jgi:glycosyltransferase involved in cell wall biosynthesis